MEELRQLTLKKEDEEFIFRYEPGLEEQLLDSFVDLANDNNHSFDWFDAAVMSFQLSKHLVEQADQYLCHDRQALLNPDTTPLVWPNDPLQQPEEPN